VTALAEAPAIRAVDLVRVFDGVTPVTALDGASLTVRRGERAAVLGPSGAGKSTLLNVLGLLDEPTSGSYELAGHDTVRLHGRDRDRLRSELLGFVFQAYHVLGHRTVRENVHLKLATARVPTRGRHELVDAALDRVGLSHRADALGRNLSGGEKQRLAIARAVVGGPQVLLADEPTGNLDDDNAAMVLALLDDLARSGVTVVVITHDTRIGAWADSTHRLEVGRFVPQAVPA
jgi:putative ABC transport system ATP-binding protein